MSYVRTIAPEDATGELKEHYARDLDALGYVPNYTRILCLRPKAIAAWRSLSRAVKADLPLRRYELVTIAAALALTCHY
jgi:hypothetical protein